MLSPSVPVDCTFNLQMVPEFALHECVDVKCRFKVPMNDNTG